MSATHDDLKAAYASAIASYAAVPSEATLEPAYEIGRKAMAGLFGIVDLAAMHQRALQELLSHPPCGIGAGEVADRAMRFLLEALSPFEMTLRGFRDAIERLERETEVRREAAQAVEAERRRLFDVLETLPQMICLLTSDYHVAFANRSFRERFGEAKGGRCYEYCFGRTGPCEFCESYEVLKTGRPHHWEVNTVEGCVIETFDFPFTDVDGAPMILEMDIDVSERRRAERDLQRAHEHLALRAEQLRALAGELTLSERRERRRLARLLHDHLQQLLFAAKMQVARLGSRVDESAQAAVKDLDELLSTSLSASRSLTAELSPPLLHQGGLVSGLQWLVRWMADTHHLTVDLDLAEGLPGLPEDMTVLLFESVRELLFNVAKHAGVDAARVQVRVEDHSLRLVVSDHGNGFEAGQLKTPGTLGGGFGLFGIRERVGLIGGKIDIDSAPGRGCGITIAVPVAQATAAAQRGDIGPAPGSQSEQVTRREESKIRVLLVDDHVVVRNGLERLVKNDREMEVVGQAADGRAALALARTLMPDVVLMDLAMPVMDGIDATRILTSELPKVQVIGLTMHEETDQVRALLAAGAVACLSKRDSADEILAAIRAYGKNRYRRVEETIVRSPSVS
jgi:signal transduction histidine kinase/ActR/RegA family two-component response regulator